jgi:hypothetical protein
MINQKSNQKNHLMKSSWNLGRTQTMRVPIVIKDYLIEIARHLDDGGTIELYNISQKQLENTKTKDAKNILSQDTIAEITNILKNGITSKNQGGVYNSSNASTLKKEVVKVLAILEQAHG